MAVLDRLMAPDSGFQERFFFLARRFVPGETIDSALEAVATLNAAGMAATLDFLGEDVSQASEAQRTCDTYVALLGAIATAGARANASVKLTALGLGIDRELALSHLRDILAAAAPLPDPFVRIDMEGSALTTATLEVFETVFREHRNVGPVIQAYLHRSSADVERAIELGARVRLCKGAYKESPEVAYQDMPTIRREYMRLAEALLQRGVYPGIATHDERLITAVKQFARDHQIGADRFEFQMLYGIRPDVQRELVAEGYRVRVYVPFGTHWAGYFYRRLAERKENVLFVMRSLISR